MRLFISYIFVKLNLFPDILTAAIQILQAYSAQLQHNLASSNPTLNGFKPTENDSTQRAEKQFAGGINRAVQRINHNNIRRTITPVRW